MSRSLITSVAVLCVFLATAGADGVTQDPASPDPTQTSVADPAAQAKIQQFMEGDSVFIENAGQWPEFIRFALDSRGANVGLTDQGPRFQLFRTSATFASEQPRKAGTVASERPLGSETGLSPVSVTETGLTPISPVSVTDTGLTPVEHSGDGSVPALSDPSNTPPPPSEMHEFALVFDGASAVTPVGRGPSDRKFNYLVGDASKHREGVGSFDTVWYENLYPGVSLELTGRRTGLKYNFHVAPGADCATIRLRYEDIAGLRLTEDGALEIRVKADWEPLTDGAPYIYQEVNGEKHTIAGSFVLIDDHTYGFTVTGDYDATLPLVIDPVVEWGSYLGGTGTDRGYGIAVDLTGACRVTGSTTSSGWVSGGWDTTLNGTDGYVVKLDSAGIHLWSTYLGGAGTEYGYGIAADSGGACYATGYTTSSGWTSGGWNTVYNGGTSDGYVVKLDGAGGHVWSTYLGGTDSDYGFGIAADSSGACYVTGTSESGGWVSGGWGTILGGVSDGYVVKLSSAGGHMWSTYLGGSGREYSYGIAVDASGACYATGNSVSSGWVSGGWDTTLNGTDGYVVKLDNAGAHMWSTYLGGSSTEYGRGIAVDASGSCYATGDTFSSGWISGGWDTVLDSSSDGYVVKLNSAGGHEWSTYMGGTSVDRGYGIAVDLSGGCYATGYTQSSGWTSNSWGTVYNGGTSDGYIVKLDSAGGHLWSFYVGGTSDDTGNGIAVSQDGANVWVTGETSSAGWVSNGWITGFGGGTDGFVVKAPGSNAVGSLQLMITPEEVIAAGAQWRRVGTDTWLSSGHTETDVLAGLWEIEFKDIYGWTTPEAITVEVPENGTAQETGTYTFIPRGSLQVMITPEEAVTDGARWRRVGTDTWLSSGHTETDVLVGLWDIEFEDIYGWTTPEIQSVEVSESATAQGTGTYSFIPRGSLHVMMTPEEAVTDGAQWRRTGTDTWLNSGETETNILAGTWTVEFKVVGGWIEPLPVSVEIPVDGTAHVTAGYIVAPFSLSWGTYLGGSGFDRGWGEVAVDADGNCYATGETRSGGWVSGGWDTTLGGGEGGYVVKLNRAGGHEWSTYVDGSTYGIALDTSGAVHVTGWTYGLGWVSGGWDTTFNGGKDGIVVKLNSAGGYAWSTYLGGANYDYGEDIAVDASGACYVTGRTDSSGWISGGYDTTYDGEIDGFVVKLDSTGGHVWSTYVGGTNTDYGYGVTADAAGNCYATGETRSAGWVNGGWDPTLNNDGVSPAQDGYLVKLNSVGEHLWSTYLGGMGTDTGRGIAVDSSGACYVTGATTSGGWIHGGWDASLSGVEDNYVVKLNSSGGHLWSTYLGGTGFESIDFQDIAVDSSGACYATGRTSSIGWVSGGWDAIFDGLGDYDYDAYVVKLNSAGGHVWSSYLGGTASETGCGIAVDLTGDNVWVTGNTTSAGWIVNGWRTVYGGDTDAFVVKIAGANARGSLQVTIVPEEAVLAGAQWRRPGTTTWRNSGYTETSLPAGQYILEYKVVPGWRAPSEHVVTVPADSTCPDISIYEPIDEFMTWSTYLGGTGTDRGYGIAVDANDACYATGYTDSSGWVEGGWDTELHGSYDVYVVKMNSAGGHVWSTYLGGTDSDYGADITLDLNGDCYVTGKTASSGWVSGGWDTSYNGGNDGFVAKLNSAGGYIWSTYLGGAANDSGAGVAVNSDGYCYVAGTTSSGGWVSGGANTTYKGGDYNGGSDGYIVKMSSAGSHLWSTYSGNGLTDNYSSIAIDSTGGCCVAGSYYYQTYPHALSMEVVSRLTSAGAYLWTRNPHDAHISDIVLDSNDACYFTGNDGWALFVGKLTSEGNIEFIRNFGSYNLGSSIAMDSRGNCYVTGYTNLGDWAVGGWDTSFKGDYDGFVLKCSSAGTHEWSSYLGGSSSDLGLGIAVNSSGTGIWVTGYTSSSGWVSNGWKTTYGGGDDAFVVKIVDPVPGTPASPSNPGATAMDLDSISWTWQDNSDDETSFKGYVDEGDTAPLSVTWTTPANTGSWIQELLAVNSPYTFQVCATNDFGDSEKTPAYTAWTLIEPVAGLTFSDVGLDTISVTAANPISNLAGGTSGLQFTNTTTGLASSWLQDTAPWTSGGLTPNTLYSFSGQSRNGVSITTEESVGSEYTLAANPSVGNNLTTDRISGLSYPLGTVFEFVNPADFGTSTHGGSMFKVSSYCYAWDTDPDYVFTGMEPVWNAGTLALSPTISGVYYLHVQSMNEAGLACGTLGYGPFVFDADAPGAPVVSGPALTNNPRPTWAWTPGGWGIGTYRHEMDFSGIWVDTIDMTFTPVVDLVDGMHTLRVRERDEAGNWSADGSFEIIVDTIPPVAPLVSGPALTNNPRPTWTWTPGGGGNGTYRYDLDASGVWVETIDLTFTPAVGLEDGPHTLRVQERDAAGNWSPDGFFEVVVDVTPPAAPLVSGPALTNNPRPTWTWSSGGGGNGTYRYDLDATGVWVETIDLTFTPAVGLEDGPHTLRVQERDDAGNWSPGGFFEVVVDVTPPGAPVVSGPALTNNPRPTWTWSSGGDGNGTYRHDLDASGAWLLTTEAVFTPTTDLGDGTHMLRVQERDDAGNWSTDGSHALEINTAELTAAFSLMDSEETAADSIAFAVTFSTDVTPTFDLSVISVTGSLAGAVSIEGTDPDYTVTVTLTDPDADGTVGIAVAGGVVHDAYGNLYAGGVSPEYQIYNWLEPWFTEMPAGIRKYTGDDYAFNALANCAAPSLTYQWNWMGNTGVERLGPPAPSWNLTDLAIIQSGTLWCEASYDGMAHATPPVTLQVEEPLEIVTPPVGGTKFAGDTHAFSVTVSGGYDPLHYQWRKDGTVVPEAPDSSSWTLSTLTQEHSGSYTVVVTDDNGMTVESLSAELVVESGLAGPNAVLLAALIVVLALFGGLLLRRAVSRQNL